MSEDEYLIALSTFTAFGPKRLTLLLSYFESAKNLWNAKKSDLIATGLRNELIKEFYQHKVSFDTRSYLVKLKKLEIKAITIKSNDYPVNLKEIPDAPHVLYVKGDLHKSDSRSVAIVGTRLMTNYGKVVAQKMAAQLGTFGITVVSGLALGIDAVAQRAAYEVGGRTIGVLASGLDIITPLTNKSLALSFIGKGGAIVSEYPLGYSPKPYDFPLRDRIISGLSKAVIVVEGRMKSGTFYTAKAAADQGRTVFAIPGQITSPASEGPNYLIQNGARVLTNVKDVLGEFDQQFKIDENEQKNIIPENGIETILCGILEKQTLHLDEIVRISHEPVNEVSARLTIMEMKGLVQNLGAGVYAKL